MKRYLKLVALGLCSTALLCAGTLTKGKVLSAEGNLVNSSASLDVQGLETYYIKKLGKGVSIQTSLNDYLQEHIAVSLANTSPDVHAKKVLAGVMDSKTGEMVMLASNASESVAGYTFCVKHTLLPLVLSMEENPKKVRQLNHDAFKRHISEVLIPKLTRFGITKPSGIDLPHEKVGKIVNDYENDRVYAEVNLLQLLSVYSVFSKENSGYRVVPHLATAFVENNVTTKINYEKSRVIGHLGTRIIREYLRRASSRNKGLIYIDGINILGMQDTTENVDANEVYVSYVAEVSDSKNHSYTVAVVVVQNLDDNYTQPAYRIFNKIIFEMVNGKLLAGTEAKRKKSPLDEAQVVIPFDDADTHSANSKEVLDSGYIALETLKANKQTKVYAIEDARVIFLAHSKKYGKAVVLKHKDGLRATYYNLKSIDSNLKEGQGIKSGTVLGKIEKRLKLQMTKEGKRVDPVKYMEL